MARRSAPELVRRSEALTIDGRLNARGEELEPLDERAVEGLVLALQKTEATAVAVCLMHAYANPDHERRLRDLLVAELPDLVVSLSHEVSPEAREFDRLCTTVANAYIQPLMVRYLAEFDARFSAEGLTCPILMMTAGGGMTTLDTAARLPIRLVESGPAGGAILAARIADQAGESEVLSIDMGGTTAKLCLIDDFRPQTARKFEIGRAARFIKGSGMPVRIPVIETIEIGSGGGSIASIDRQALPELVPAEGASCMYDLPLRHVPEAVAVGNTQFALELVFSGGTGARPGLDGLSATSFPSGVWGSQVETTEAVAPILITKRELRPDSGGPGRMRGGLGQHIEIRPSKEQDFLLFLSVERILNPAQVRTRSRPASRRWRWAISTRIRTGTIFARRWPCCTVSSLRISCAGAGQWS